jgi:peptidoglycan/LPS O-acetylase OafA/YrhL
MRAALVASPETPSTTPGVLSAPSPDAAAAGAPVRISELDGIRGLAILLVLLWHYGAMRLDLNHTGVLAPLWTLIGLSWSGVDLFFVLSGFLIGGLLLDHRDSPSYFKTFYVRRVCRIFPLYYLLVLSYFSVRALGISLAGPGGEWLTSGPLPLGSYALFLQNWVMVLNRSFGCNWLGITWSLAIEEQFYLLLPLVIRFIPPKRLLPVLVGGIVLAPLTRVALLLWLPERVSGAFLLMPCRADALLLGVLAAWALRALPLRWALMQYRAFLGCLLAVLGAGVVFIAYRWPSITSRPMVIWGHTWFALFYGVLLVIPVLKRDGLWASILRNPLLRGLGSISYGVYMIHQAVFGLTMSLFFTETPLRPSSALLLPVAVALALTLLIATLLYRWVEKPVIAFGQSFRY